jgi:hypothetical protein
LQHTTSSEEIKNLLAISDRDLLACQVKQLVHDGEVRGAGLRLFEVKMAGERQVAGR